MAKPMMPCSHRGVLNTRGLPKLSCRSTVQRNTPPKPTSSPNTQVRSSVCIATRMASLIALHMLVSCVLSRSPRASDAPALRGAAAAALLKRACTARPSAATRRTPEPAARGGAGTHRRLAASMVRAAEGVERLCTVHNRTVRVAHSRSGHQRSAFAGLGGCCVRWSYRLTRCGFAETGSHAR